MHLLKPLLAMAIVITLAACGGGGDSSVSALAVDKLLITKGATSTSYDIPIQTQVGAPGNVDLYGSAGSDPTFSFSYATVSGVTTVSRLYVDIAGDSYNCDNTSGGSPCLQSAFVVDPTAKTIQVKALTLKGYVSTGTTVDNSRSITIDSNLRWN